MLIRQNIFFKEGNECIYAIEIYYMHIYFTLIFLFWSYYNPWSDREQAYQTLVISVPNISKTILSHGFKYDLCKTYSTNSIKKSVYKIGISVLSPFMFVSLNVDYRSTTKCPKTSIYTYFFLTQTLVALDVCLKNSSSLAS